MGFLGKLFPPKVKKALQIILAVLTKGHEIGLYEQGYVPAFTKKEQ